MVDIGSLRFCMVTTFYPPFSFGGDGIFVYRLVQALAERGHRIDVIHSEDAYRIQHPDDPEIRFTEHANVTRYALRSRWPMLNALSAHQLGTPAAYGSQMRNLLDDGQYDVIHYHNISLMGGPGVLRQGRAIKLYTPHEYWLVCPTHVLFTFNREACTQRRCLSCQLHALRPPQLWRYSGLLEDCTSHVDRFLMPSRFALDRHHAEGLDAPMTVLPNFVPSPTPAEASTSVSERPFFLFVGRLEKLKGVQDLIRLFNDYRDADLVIVGTGSYRPVLEREARNLEHVKFVGSVHPSKIGSYYRQAIAVLVPSLCYEVFPLIAAEAFTYGTPVIARRIGALTEVVEESGGGYTFKNLNECRAIMEQLHADAELRNELGNRGRQMALANWTTDVHLRRYMDIVGELLKPRIAA